VDIEKFLEEKAPLIDKAIEKYIPSERTLKSPSDNNRTKTRLA
jgi:hypothetical protein